MHIGIVSPEFPPDIGGVETYAGQFVRELALRDHEVTVFTRRHREGEAKIPGVRIVPVLSLRRRRDCRIVREHRVDVWHAMNAAYSWLALETSPVIVSVHGNDFLRPYVLVERLDIDRLLSQSDLGQSFTAFDRLLGRWLTHRLVRQTLPLSNHIMANSKYTEKALVQHYPACLGKTSTGMVGVAEEFFDVRRPVVDPGEPPRLLTVSRLSEPRKNVDMVLHSLANLKDKHDFRYTVVGDGNMRPRLEMLVRKLGLDNRVRFTGFVRGDEIKNFMAASDLFVLTSSASTTSHEGFGIVYLEANACGTPVLAARLAGAAEAVEDGVSGMFVKMPSVKNITMALDSFLSKEVSFESENCRAFACRFTWNRVVDHALNIYDSVDLLSFQKNWHNI